MIYLTNWTVVLNVVSSLFQAFVLTLYHQNQLSLKVSGKSLPKVLKASWLLANSTSVCVGMSAIYWTMIFTKKDSGLIGLLTHAGNAIVMIFDLFVRANPPRYGHVVYPMSVGAVYGFIFTVPYIFLGGTNKEFDNFIYAAMNWKSNPAEALKFTLGSVLFVGLTHCLLTFLETTRVYLHERINARNKTKQSSTPGGRNLLKANVLERDVTSTPQICRTPKHFENVLNKFCLLF